MLTITVERIGKNCCSEANIIIENTASWTTANENKRIRNWRTLSSDAIGYNATIVFPEKYFHKERSCIEVIYKRQQVIAPFTNIFGTKYKIKEPMAVNRMYIPK